MVHGFQFANCNKLPEGFSAWFLTIFSNRNRIHQICIITHDHPGMGNTLSSQHFEKTLVVDLPHWKMMEWKSVRMMKFPIYRKMKFMFQTTKQFSWFLSPNYVHRQELWNFALKKILKKLANSSDPPKNWRLMRFYSSPNDRASSSQAFPYNPRQI